MSQPSSPPVAGSTVEQVRQSTCWTNLSRSCYCCCTQAKFCHFDKVDASKYNQLWAMQQQEACDMVRQLLAADRVIHEQQLGWQWQPPDGALFVSPHDVVPARAHSPSSTAAAAAAGGTDCCSSSGAGSRSGRSQGVSHGRLSGGGAAAGPLGALSPSSSRQVSSMGGASSILLGGPGSPTTSLSGSGARRVSGSYRGSSSGGGGPRGPSNGGAPALQLHSPPEVRTLH